MTRRLSADDLAAIAHEYGDHARIEVDAAAGRQVLVVDGRDTGDWAELEGESARERSVCCGFCGRWFGRHEPRCPWDGGTA